MAGEALLMSRIEAGEVLVRELDSAGLSPDVAAWVPLGEQDHWKLLFQFDSGVDKRASLGTVAQILAKRDDPADDLWMGDIMVVSPQDDVAVALKGMMQTDRSIGRVRIGPSFARGVFLEHGLEYRAFDPQLATAK